VQTLKQHHALSDAVSFFAKPLVSLQLFLPIVSEKLCGRTDMLVFVMPTGLALVAVSAVRIVRPTKQL
jgi:hypothetical protein